MNTLRTFAAVAAAIPLAVASVTAQAVLTVPAGLSARIVYQDKGTPFGHSGFAAHPFDGSVFVTEYRELISIDKLGRRKPLFKIPGTQIGLCRLAGLEVVFTDFDKDMLYRRHVVTGKQVGFSIPKNTFDVDVGPGGVLLASANPSWPKKGSSTGIWLLDPKGKHREVIRLTGPSGPLLFDRSGNLLYGLQSSTFPPPKGAIQIVSFAAAKVGKALAGTTPLTLKDATVIAKGLDGAIALALDDRGRLHISDPTNGGVRRTLPIGGGLDKAPFLNTSKLATLQMQFQDGDRATFDPHQPRTGGALFLATTNWQTSYEVWRIEPKRPALTTTPAGLVPKGPVRVQVTGAPRNASLLLAISVARPLSSERLFFYDSGLPVVLGLDLSKPFVIFAGRSDQNGAFTLATNNPGGITLGLTLQSLAATGSGSSRAIGTSQPWTVTLLPR